MRTINTDEAMHVTGAGNLKITQIISTDGVTDACLAVLIPSVRAAVAANLSRDEMINQIMGGCTETELDLLGDRLDETLPVQIEII